MDRAELIKQIDSSLSSETELNTLEPLPQGHLAAEQPAAQVKPDLPPPPVAASTPAVPPATAEPAPPSIALRLRTERELQTLRESNRAMQAELQALKAPKAILNTPPQDPYAFMRDPRAYLKAQGLPEEHFDTAAAAMNLGILGKDVPPELAMQVKVRQLEAENAAFRAQLGHIGEVEQRMDQKLNQRMNDAESAHMVEQYGAMVHRETQSVSEETHPYLHAFFQSNPQWVMGELMAQASQYSRDTNDVATAKMLHDAAEADLRKRYSPAAQAEDAYRRKQSSQPGTQSGGAARGIGTSPTLTAAGPQPTTAPPARETAAQRRARLDREMREKKIGSYSPDE